MRKIKFIICRSGKCPHCGKNWVGLWGPCDCGYSGPLIQDE